MGKDTVLEKDAILDVNGTVQIGSCEIAASSTSKVPAIVGRTSGVADTTKRAPDHIVLAEGLEVGV